MQKELQITLSIIGILIIGGVLIHGLWTIRKSAKKQKKARLESRKWDPTFVKEDGEAEGKPLYDDVGVGKARVVVNSELDDNFDNDEVDELSVDSAEPKQPNNISFGEENDLLETPLPDDEIVFEPTVSFETNNDSSSDDENLSHSSPLVKEHLHFESELGNDEDNVKENAVDGFSIEEPTLEINNIEEPIIDRFEEGLLEQEKWKSDLENTEESIEFSADLPDSSDNIETKTHDDSLSIQESKLTPHIESPVYSNVVTQPKPEFSKPTHTNIGNEDNFGQPPGFLLKNSGLEVEDVSDSNDIDENANENTSKIGTVEASVNFEKTTQPKPDFSLDIQEGPELTKDNVDDSLAAGEEKELSFTEQAKRFVKRNKKTVAEKIRKEPVLSDKATTDQMRMDFEEAENKKVLDDSVSSNKDKTESVETKTKTKTETPSNEETDVLVLNIRAKDESPIQGASLLPMLLTLGFKFGEHDIFHRHVSTNGKGPILFSLTNMFKPGVFDIDNIENFSTYGLSLFMMLPIEGDAQQVFNMMHNAARKMSEEFDCRILDGNKVGVSKQSLQQYVERIREFERKRINR